MKHSINQNNQSAFTHLRGAGVLFLAIVLVGGNLMAQNDKRYLSFDLGGGIHSLNYKLPGGSKSGQFGYTAELAYSYFFAPQLGLMVGAGVQSFGASSILNCTNAISAVDTDGAPYEFRITYKDWREEQQAVFIDIPLALQYRYSLARNVGILASVGAKLSIPVNANYHTTGGEIVTTGYYSQWNVELYGLPQHGFSNYTNTFSDDLSFKTKFSVIADLGCLLKLSGKTKLYLGSYVNYGLNEIFTSGSNQIYQPDGTYNGVLSSGQLHKVSPLAFGLKVGIRLPFRR